MVIVQTDSDWLERTAEWGKKKEKEEREKEKGKREEVWRVIEIFFGVKFVGTLRTRAVFLGSEIFGRFNFWERKILANESRGRRQGHVRAGFV